MTDEFPQDDNGVFIHTFQMLLNEELPCREGRKRFLLGPPCLEYNQYEGYSGGETFGIRLFRWLYQFDESDRMRILDFLSHNLLYVSRKRLLSIIDTFPNTIVPSKRVIDTKSNMESLYADSDSAFFVGMSDGAMIGSLRRRLKIPHEHAFYAGWGHRGIESIVNELMDSTAKRPIFYLVDDFIGSGISYIRTSSVKRNGMKEGKLVRFLTAISKSKCDAKICVVPYLATTKAVNHILTMTDEVDVDLAVKPLQIIDNVDCAPVMDILERMDSKMGRGYLDCHYAKGSTNHPFLGFDECSLMLVLEHNTPNNTLPIIWYGDNALFPRIARHRISQTR